MKSVFSFHPSSFILRECGPSPRPRRDTRWGPRRNSPAASRRRRSGRGSVCGANHPGYNAGMQEATDSTLNSAQPDPSLFDLGHQGDVDRTQIAALLAMSPTERLRHHEPWRLFVKEALKNAALRRKDRGGAG